MQIDTNSNIPIYEQIYENLLEYISKGILQIDDKLPSVRELSSKMHINPNTVVKAYRMLEDNGFIYSLPGKGSFVSEKKTDQRKVLEQDILLESKKLILKCKYLEMTYDELCQLLQEHWEDK